MSMTDPIADMLTRIRNANMNRWESVDIPSSKLKLAILRVLQEDGFIKDYKEFSIGNNKNTVRVYLKYGPLRQRVINHLEKVSKSGRRIYIKAGNISKVFGGMGTAIYSTSKGIVSDKDCRKANIGGELLCVVY
ncbi:MAG: 30S ribosomal protein S8 [wastewater metagenome]|nr:30S ribosomal protein S8 [Candidatus Loosdrechtia aerotolerans]